MTPREEDLDAERGKMTQEVLGRGREKGGQQSTVDAGRIDLGGLPGYVAMIGEGEGRMGMKKRGEKKGTTLAMKLRVR